MSSVRSPRRPGTHAGIDWTSVPLGRETDNELARRLGVATGSVARQRVRRKIPRCDRSRVSTTGCLPLLGQLSDRKVAELCGLDESAVRAQRARRGVSAYRPRVEWDREPLGATWDTAIAARLNVSVSAVCDARRRRKVPIYKEVRVCGCGRRYKARQPNQTACSKACSLAVQNALNAGTPAEILPARVALAALKRDIKRRRHRVE